MLQYGKQPLHYAIEEGHIETARLLLEKGAPVDAVDEVSAWECGLVEEQGHAWESTGLLLGGSVWYLRQVVMHPWCCAAG